MKTIKKLLGITELTEEQKETNDLLKKIIDLQRHIINNQCEVHSNKTKARY